MRKLFPVLGLIGAVVMTLPVQAAPGVDLGTELSGLMAVANTRDPRFHLRNYEASEFLLSRKVSVERERLDTRAPRLLVVPVGDSTEAGVGVAVRLRF